MHAFRCAKIALFLVAFALPGSRRAIVRCACSVIIAVALRRARLAPRSLRGFYRRHTVLAGARRASHVALRAWLSLSGKSTCQPIALKSLVH